MPDANHEHKMLLDRLTRKGILCGPPATQQLRGWVLFSPRRFQLSVPVSWEAGSRGMGKTQEEGDTGCRHPRGQEGGRQPTAPVTLYSECPAVTLGPRHVPVGLLPGDQVWGASGGRADGVPAPGSDRRPRPRNPTGPGRGPGLSSYVGPCEHGVTPDEVTVPAWPRPRPALNGAKNGCGCWAPGGQPGRPARGVGQAAASDPGAQLLLETPPLSPGSLLFRPAGHWEHVARGFGTTTHRGPTAARPSAPSQLPLLHLTGHRTGDTWH